MFLSELIRIMQKYPWCDGVDIDLEGGGDYSTAAKSTAMFQNIHHAVKSYDARKRINICLPGMTSVNGSVGGENWCVYADLAPYCDTGIHYELRHGLGGFCSGAGGLQGIGWKVSTTMPYP